jgi:hypothetical protein
VSGPPGRSPQRPQFPPGAIPSGRGWNILPEPAILRGPTGGRLDRGRAGNLLEACAARGAGQVVAFPVKRRRADWANLPFAIDRSRRVGRVGEEADDTSWRRQLHEPQVAHLLGMLSRAIWRHIALACARR